MHATAWGTLLGGFDDGAPPPIGEVPALLCAPAAADALTLGAKVLACALRLVAADGASDTSAAGAGLGGRVTLAGTHAGGDGAPAGRVGGDAATIAPRSWRPRGAAWRAPS